jgi:hypothetical protein
MLEDISMS